MSIKRDILWRIYLVFFGACLFGAAVIIQTLRVQNTRPDYWLAKSDSISVRFRAIPADRGNIFSSDGRLLATTLPTFDIRMDMRADGLTDELFEENIKPLCTKLARYFRDRSAASYEQKLRKARRDGNRYLLVKRNVNYRAYQQMRQWPLWNLGAFKGGIIVVEKSTRKTPFGQLAHRTIGYSRDNAQDVGLEASFNEYLKGEQGKRLMYRIAGGTWIPVNKHNEIDPKNGVDIISTIDVNIQDVTQSTLYEVVKENHAEWGTAIVMEVATGKIKAIANLKETANGRYSEAYNYAVGYRGEPGSTMKLVTLASLLEHGYVTIEDSIDINNGTFKLPRKTIKDSEGWHPYRNVTVQKAFERSSNVGFTKMAYTHYRNNPEQFLDQLKAFGFDKKCGIELTGEKPPFFRYPGDEGWSSLSLPSISYGYEISMTPMQMLTFYNAVANDGKMMKPYLVEGIAEHGKIIETFEPKVVKESICSPNTIAQLKKCLEGVVEQGTGRSLKSEHYHAAGKTGTTKLAVPGYGYGKYYTASFAGYFPAEDPQYSMIVVVNKPTGGRYYGGSVAGPVFNAVADMLYAKSFNIHKPINDSLEHKQFPAYIAGNSTSVSNINKQIFKAGYQPIGRYTGLTVDSLNVSAKELVQTDGHMPDVRKMGLDDALYLLENLGLRVQTYGVGVVKHQSIKAGEKISEGQVVDIKLGT